MTEPKSTAEQFAEFFELLVNQRQQDNPFTQTETEETDQ